MPETCVPYVQSVQSIASFIIVFGLFMAIALMVDLANPRTPKDPEPPKAYCPLHRKIREQCEDQHNKE